MARALGWRRRKGGCFAKRADAFGRKHSGTALLSLQVLASRKEPSGKLFGEPFSHVVGITDGHIQYRFGQAFVLGVRISLYHDGHPMLESLWRETGHIWLICDGVLHEVVLTLQVAVDLGQGCIGQFSENGCTSSAHEQGPFWACWLLTMPWVNLVEQLNVGVELVHFGRRDDQAFLRLIMFNLPGVSACARFKAWQNAH